ncbi:MAG TPA: hypothetical protein ENK99_05775 [Campylobacterales bacterium]|nr:hypothetical protein [Campylobacterales bacterium]
MQIFKDILYEEDEHAIIGFINSSGNLEFSLYKTLDGGVITLEDKVYQQEKLLELLKCELASCMDINK